MAKGREANSGRVRYVDGFVLSVPKDKVDTHHRIARTAGKVWREHEA